MTLVEPPSSSITAITVQSLRGYEETSSEDENNEDEISPRNMGLTQKLGHPGDRLAPTTFGEVSIENSSDVHFGDKNFYNGPVTIRQIVYANGSSALTASDGGDKGKDNLGFDGDSGVLENVKPVIEEGGVPKSGLGKGFIWLQNVPKHKPVEIGIFVVVVVLFVAVLTVVLLLKHPPTGKLSNSSRIISDEPNEQVRPHDYDSAIVTDAKLKDKLRMVTRVEWVAQPPTGDTTPLKTPVPYVIIHHTATENCSSQGQCVLHVRQIQAFHIESRGWFDIGYNFLVGGDGSGYEGRGWTIEGAHTLGWNNKSIGIAFIGTFTKTIPPDIQVSAGLKLISKGVELGYISKDYKILAAKQLFGTESPGAALFDKIKKWDHWSQNV